MRIIGITGGIGCGKTTVCGIFSELGVPVYYADDRAKAVMMEDESLMATIRCTFGDEAYKNGELNRPYLAHQVFGSEEKLTRLNAVVHPAVARDFMKWANAIADVPYIIKEAAILFESGAYRTVQQTVLVTAPENVRIERVMQRDSISETEVRQRMDSQWPEERKAQMADHVIVNDGHQLLIPQVLELHGKFIG
ncbi:MAG: dephospho-CoA kinase [Flavobacteriales bacterium]|nr:dephospho-CoA kinase [Flavobacteriales bacterium]